MHDDSTTRRKDAHLDVCATEEVAPVGNATLFEDVHFLHNALPEMAVNEVKLETQLFGKTLKAPLLMTGMTGGTERAQQVNRDLATVAEEFGIAFGVGSQRAMAEKPELAATFSVRSVAPTTVIIGNIGVQQAVTLGVDGVRRLTDAIGADGLAVHLNPGQELTQPEGDRDFRGGYDIIRRLTRVYGSNLLVKETGCGISPEVAKRLIECGVTTIDVSGLGGTSWVRVEELRASGPAREVGSQFSNWGIPTAVAIASVREATGLAATLIASGGLRNGLDVAKALALGADIGGMALPMFRAQQQNGVQGVRDAVQMVLMGLRQAFVLTGSRTVGGLRSQKRVIGPTLIRWLAAL